MATNPYASKGGMAGALSMRKKPAAAAGGGGGMFKSVANKLKPPAPTMPVAPKLPTAPRMPKAPVGIGVGGTPPGIAKIGAKPGAGMGAPKLPGVSAPVRGIKPAPTARAPRMGRRGGY